MDKDKIILTAIAGILAEAYEYKPNQIQAMMGDKYKSFMSSFNGIDEREFEKELIKLFNEYLSVI